MRRRTIVTGAIGGFVLLVFVAAGLLLPNGMRREAVSELAVSHIHGMGMTPEGRLVLAAHSGLRVFDGKRWSIPEGERHDYMGFSLVEGGFYASGHPAPGSTLRNPLGLVFSSDLGRNVDLLALYGESDLHVMAAGYRSQVIYAWIGPEDAGGTFAEAGLYVSSDRGKTWTKRESDGLFGPVYWLAVHPDDGQTVAVLGEGGVFLSHDAGKTFERLDTEAPVTALSFTADGRLRLAVADRPPRIDEIEGPSGRLKPLDIPSLPYGDRSDPWAGLRPGERDHDRRRHP